MTKLPVFQTVRDVWRFIWQERRDLFFLAAPFVVVLSLVNAITSGLTIEPTEVTDTAATLPGIQLLILVQIIVGVVVTTLFSVTWHRRSLVPEESVTVAATLSWSTRHWRFLRALLTLFGIYMAVAILLAIVITGLILPVLLTSDAPAEVGQNPLLFVIALPVLVYCLVRLSLLFPAAAVDERLSVKACWRRTRGNGWRIFSIYVLASIPLFLIISAVSLIFSILLPGAEASITVFFIGGLVQQMLFYFSFAVGISVLSRVYYLLTQPGGTSPARSHPT